MTYCCASCSCGWAASRRRTSATKGAACCGSVAASSRANAAARRNTSLAWLAANATCRQPQARGTPGRCTLGVGSMGTHSSGAGDRLTRGCPLAMQAPAPAPAIGCTDTVNRCVCSSELVMASSLPVAVTLSLSSVTNGSHAHSCAAVCRDTKPVVKTADSAAARLGASPCSTIAGPPRACRARQAMLRRPVKMRRRATGGSTLCAPG